ncbi:nodal modulator 3 [Scaptodrosophila lebanonensis]|uniref:Nodal modulator 3 n=1 Tax=Drosophila lebanonensis TaxID=7225 RepID=A0A6J2TY22_DROLE|nr:nodal modulator 3 [Scaptodrosophila lebanonensis]
MRLSGVFLILLIKFVGQIKAQANEVLGCGGFIKSHADIDFSKVEIKLLTKQGSLKDKTDCSPSNGYYFLPIYDKGEYLLSISPPPGWSFEPKQVPLTFDGKTDVCQGKDVNFVFKGFGITGKVALSGGSGARDVDVELKSEKGELWRTKSDINGVFSFTPIIPGNYVLRASHANWHFSKAEHNVVVKSGNTELPNDALVVSGFDVNGHFDASSQLPGNIGVVLYRRKGQTLVPGCDKSTKTLTNKVKSEFESDASCYTLVEKSGEYNFKNVPMGKYLLQAVNENSNLKLHLSPEYIEVEVGKDTLELKEQFRITGFTVTGQVLSSATGVPIKNAIVKLDNRKVAETDAKGSYTLTNIKAGTYTIEIESPQLQFEPFQVKVQISTPTLPTIVPSAYEVCGKVTSSKSYVLGITKIGSTFHTTATTQASSGNWCTYLPAGKYNIVVLTTDADKTSGIQFFPVTQQTEVQDEPINGITFSQVKAKLRGQLQCLPDATATCTSAEVTLQSLDATGQPTEQKWRAKAHRGKYTFKDVLPGPYEISIPQDNLCYESTRVFLNVASAEEEAPPFIHKGYEVSIISSHRALMKYTHVTGPSDPPPAVETLKILSGVNTFCVSKYGSYDFKLEGCHIYDDTLPSKFITSEPDQMQTLIINAIAHKTGVRVLSTEPSADSLKLAIESESLGKQIITPIAESHKVDGKYAYRYETYLKPDEILNITPLSQVLLFAPTSQQIVGGGDCVDIAFNFVATRGLILRGKVVPPIKDAKITLSFPNNPDIAVVDTLTSVTGEFQFGPIDEALQFDLKAEKESYVFTEYNRQSASFGAHKLCEVAVIVKDEAGQPLSGVLLSLSGSETYRKNLITGDNGAINFHSLSPSQYYLRPMMKEYKFEPNSKMIDIKDGETISVTLVGKRYAYSIFGTITSLNGDPFAEVTVEATADEGCMHQQEEAISENNGQYRIRGLQPGCSYTVRVKPGDPNVDRSIPPKHTISVGNADVRDVNLIAINPIKIVDVTARITAALNEHYKTLRIVMYRRGQSDSPVFSQRVPSPLNPKSSFNPGIMVYFPRIPRDGKSYVVELQSTLSEKTYSYKLPSFSFVADRCSVFVQLEFKPEVRTAEADLNQNSISALVLIALVAIAFFKQDLAVNFLNFVWGKLSDVAADFSQRQKTKTNVRKNEPINQRQIEQMAEQINAVKKRQNEQFVDQTNAIKKKKVKKI